jgi:hypothetical protein
MFRAARSLVRLSGPWSEGLSRAVTFARDRPDLFRDPDYWDRVERHDFRGALDTVTGWARDGWERLAQADCWSQDWEFFLLDLGDCPEIFRLYMPGGQTLMSEAKFRELLSREEVIGCSALTGCFAPSVPAPFERLFGDERATWAYHNVRELADGLLSWNARSTGRDYHGDSGDFLWLVVGSLALLAPLRDADCCKGILRGRERVYLLAGFEEIFTHLATVTPEGIRYEDPASPAAQPRAADRPGE